MEYQAPARQAQDGGWSYESYLQDLLERELLKRRENVAARRLKEARFPDIKTLDQLEWTALRGVSKTKLQALSTGQYKRYELGVLCGSPFNLTYLGSRVMVNRGKRRCWGEGS